MARFLKDKQKSKGAAPGSLIFIGQPETSSSQVQVTHYNEQVLQKEELSTLDNLSDYLYNDQISWITVNGIHNTSAVEKAGKIFEIPALILEDILNTDERPKFSEDDRHIFIIIKSLYYNETNHQMQMEQIALVLGDHYLLTLQESGTNYFEDVHKRLYSGISRIRSLPADYLCYALLDTLVDSYILNIEKLGTHIEEQEKVLLTPRKKIIEDIYRYKTELAYTRKNIRPVKELVTRFVTSDSDLIHDRTYAFLRDLEGLVTQALEAVEIYYTMVSDQQNSYNANISNSVNDVMKVLTIFSAIFIPLTFIVGVYGMNFVYIPALQHQDGYFILWGVMVFLVLMMLLFFKRKGWF